MTEQASSGTVPTGLHIRLRKSTNRRTSKHRACVAGLGLRRIGDEVHLPDRPEIRGMVNRVRYLLDVTEVAEVASRTPAHEEDHAPATARDKVSNPGQDADSGEQLDEPQGEG